MMIGHCEIHKYFIAMSVDVNVKDSTGMDAVHQCVRSGQLQCLKDLVDNGADLDVKCDGMTLLQQACLHRKSDIVEYLISLPSCTRAVKIEALELLGAKFGSTCRHLQRARNYWLWSLGERSRAEPGDNVPPKRDEPRPTFGNRREFQTEQDLTALRFSDEEMWMQSMIITERILGHQPKSLYALIARAWSYAREGNFDRCIPLFIHVLDMQEQSDGVEVDTLMGFCSLITRFEWLMMAGYPVNYEHVMSVFMKTVAVLEHDMKPHLDQPWNCTTFDEAVSYVVRSIRLLAQLQPTTPEDKTLQLHKILYRFVHMDVRDAKGHTPLHLACLNKLLPYSPLDVVQLLLKVDADPQAVTLNGDTPLHTLATNQHQSQHDTIKLLLSSGAHYDACNADGKCFTELLARGHALKFESPMTYLSLKCLSAKAVKRYGIPFESEEVPSCVSEFIKMH